MFHLTEGEKVLVLAVCVGLLAITIILTVCVVTPFCWIYNCIHMHKKNKKQNGDVDWPGEKTYIQLSGSPQYTVEAGPPLRSLSKTVSETSQFGRVSKKREDSTYSSMSSGSRGDASVSTYSETSMDAPLANGDADANYGQVTFCVRFRTEENNPSGQMIIVLKEAQDLPPRQYGGTCDPYLTLSVYKDRGRKRWSKQSMSCQCEFKTSTKKKTQHPLFKETFVIDVVMAELKDFSLRITAYDDEKYANDSEMGQVTMTLKELHPYKPREDHVLTLDFTEPRQDNGEILFGLSYLPTAERLTFNIVKANNLRSIVDDPDSFAPFVRVLLMHNGKLLKKKKTSPRSGTTCPVFNESLTFDIPPSQLDHVIFLIVTSHRDPQDGVISSPDSPTTPGSSKKGRHIGKVVIGGCAKGTALNHWNAMRQSPRKQVIQWHTLR